MLSDKGQIGLPKNTKSNLFVWQLSCWRDQYQWPACVSAFLLQLKTALGVHFTPCQLQLAKKHLAMPSKSNKLMQMRATELVVPVQFICVWRLKVEIASYYDAIIVRTKFGKRLNWIFQLATTHKTNFKLCIYLRHQASDCVAIVVRPARHFGWKNKLTHFLIVYKFGQSCRSGRSLVLGLSEALPGPCQDLPARQNLIQTLHKGMWQGFISTTL